jgi:hypothetical protein
MSNPFLSEQNKAMLQRVLYSDITRRIGDDLTEKQAQRLVRTVEHYVNEVDRVEGNYMSVKEKNANVLKRTLPDYMSYLERKQRSSARSVMSDMEEGPSLAGQKPIQMNGYIEDRTPQRSQMDVSNAFAQLQAQRQEQRKTVPPQDFRLQLQDEGPVSLETFSQMKQEREEEAKRTALLQQQQAKISSGQQQYANATEAFSRDKRRADEEAEQAFAERERARLEQRVSSGSQLALQPPPDMRALFMGEKTQIGRTMNQSAPNSSAGNPTIAQPNVPFARESSGQQMIITREPDIMTYKETELNLFVYSGDRDWVTNSSETRYNFSVNFDPSNLPTGLRLSPSSTVKFRNITRVEFVKAIMPGEGLDLLVTKTAADAYDSAINMNILSYPYIQVRIPELDNNNNGTNQGLNAAFGVLQYDANWITDTTNDTARGYFAMIPKFLKCQKVYTPTPLSTIQKLTFRFERPDGSVLSTIPDTLDIKYIIPTFAMTAGVMTNGGALTNTVYQQDPAVDISGSAYYWLKTSTYFNHWTVSKGDRIVMKNLTWSADPTGSAVTQLQDTLTYLQQDIGHVVVGTGVITGTDTSSWIFNDGYNAQGYANAILVRGKFIDPALTGGLYPVAPGDIDDQVASGYLSDFLINTSLTKGRLLNQSHQVQVSMRIIVREMDPMGFLRPDNL